MLWRDVTVCTCGHGVLLPKLSGLVGPAPSWPQPSRHIQSLEAPQRCLYCSLPTPPQVQQLSGDIKTHLPLAVLFREHWAGGLLVVVCRQTDRQAVYGRVLIDTRAEFMQVVVGVGWMSCYQPTAMPPAAFFSPSVVLPLSLCMCFLHDRRTFAVWVGGGLRLRLLRCIHVSPGNCSRR